MKATRAYLGALLTAAAVMLAPRAAMAVQCNVAHTFITGEPLVQSVLNANPTQFASCLSNLDYRNVGASGFFASQIIPQSTAQATFGGTIPYTFVLPPSFSQPLSQANGGTGTNNGVINNIKLGGNPGLTFSNPGLFAVANTSGGGYSISLDSSGYNPMYLGNYNTGMPSINMGVYGAWAILRSDGMAIPSDNNATNRTQYQATGITIKNAVQSAGLFLRAATGNVAWYDNTRGRQSDVEIDFANQRMQADGFKVNTPAGGSTQYMVPFDAQSTSNSARTHQEHGSDTQTIAQGTSSVCTNYTFAVPYSGVPDIQITPYTGGSSRPYVNSRSTTGMQICVNSGIFDTVGNIQAVSSNQSVGYGWVVLGE